MSMLRATQLRIGAVSYLNARPLIYGLDNAPDVSIALDVPSKLLQGLRAGAYDVALLPVIDYQRLGDLTILPAGGIGCDGPTLTVRVFSRVPMERIRTLACDPDSHTSVALARIILARRHDVRPEFRDLSRAGDSLDEARLLIGDKVVCEEPQGFEHQLDLGSEWKAMTGLPFVFAVWMTRAGADVSRIYPLLEEAKENGLKHVEELIRQFAVPRGWPADLARRYLTEFLDYHVGPRELNAIRKFHQLAAEEGIIPQARPLYVFSPAAISA